MGILKVSKPTLLDGYFKADFKIWVNTTGGIETCKNGWLTPQNSQVDGRTVRNYEKGALVGGICIRQWLGSQPETDGGVTGRIARNETLQHTHTNKIKDDVQ